MAIIESHHKKTVGKLPHFLLISSGRDKTLRLWDSAKEDGTPFAIELPLEYNFLKSVNNGGLCITRGED